MATCPTCLKKHADEVETCPDDGSTLIPDQILGKVDQTLTTGLMVGEYKIVGELGRGSFGEVYSAEHPLIGKAAAVKVLKRELSSDAQVVSRFISEARAVNKIRHRNIIDIFSFGLLDDGRQYFIMELLDGVTLKDHLKQRGALPVDEAMPLLGAMARALDAAHKSGIAHRDLNPENIFLCFEDDGNCYPKLLDFGIAKLMGNAGAEHQTRTGAAMGTPLYMSPEQCRGKNVDHRTDIYAFGCLVHRMLTGKVVFRGDSVMDVLISHTTEPPPAMSSVNSALPTDLDQAVLQMLAKVPAERPNTVGEAFDLLLDAASAVGLVVPEVTRPISSARGSAAGMAAVSRPGAAEPAPGAPSSIETNAATVVRVGAGAGAQAPTSTRDPSSSDGDGSTFHGVQATLEPAPSGAAAARKMWLPLAAAAVVLAAGGAYLLGTAREPVTGTTAELTSDVPQASAQVQPPAEPSPNEASEAADELERAVEPIVTTVRLKLTTVPPDVVVFADEIRLGHSGEELSLARASKDVTLRLTKDGFIDKHMQVRPDKDITLQLELTRTPGSQPRLSGKRTPNGHAPAAVKEHHADVDRPNFGSP